MTGGQERRKGDDGTALLLALVLIFVVGFAGIALGRMATGAMTTAQSLRTQRISLEDAQAATTVAIQYVRYNYTYTTGAGAQYVYTSTSEPCLPSGVTIPTADSNRTATNPFVVSCTGSVNPTHAATRTVIFTACINTGSATCPSGRGVLQAVVTFDDHDGTGQDACYGGSVSSCGTSMNIQTWDITGADR